jgi:hypothetical protein
MTIKFDCPNCYALIAFDDKHSGKRARCLTCGQIFIIPAKDGQTPEIVEPVTEKAEPLPGFYRAVFVNNWKLFIDPQNATSLVFITALVCFRFFLAHTACCCGHITFFIAWGWLFGFYLNIIYETAFGIDKLPEIYLGTIMSFLWYAIKPFLIFSLTMAVVLLPFFITLSLLHNRGPTYDNIWQPGIGLHSILQILFILGLFVFPIAVLTIAIGKDVTLLRPDYLFKTIRRAFIPYLIVVVLLVAFGVIEMQTSQYNSQLPLIITAARLTLNLLVQIIAITAMRSIGLFYRHYSPHFPW